MSEETNLNRFIDAQDADYPVALSEIKQGRKKSHWMWYIFPQIQGLGFSETSKYYAKKNVKEAVEFLKHPVLGNRLINICQALLDLPVTDANKVFGSPDDLKLKSSITLFASLPDTNPVFQLLIEKYFNGMKDNKTLALMRGT
jgi:uncharacterized protein (DUF1810 family)